MEDSLLLALAEVSVTGAAPFLGMSGGGGEESRFLKRGALGVDEDEVEVVVCNDNR